MSQSEDVDIAKKAALRFVSYRPRSESEVRSRLLKSFTVPVVEAVISELVRLSVIDDVQFAKLWCSSRESLNPKSAKAIKQELISKGISESTAISAVRELDDFDTAMRVSRKYLKRLTGSSYDQFTRRLYGYLQRRGFSSSLILEISSILWAEVDSAKTEFSEWN